MDAILVDKEVKELMNMELHSTKLIEGTTYVTKVPGGWIYITYRQGSTCSVFVPFPKPIIVPLNNE